jgi:hypothetical protein
MKTRSGIQPTKAKMCRAATICGMDYFDHDDDEDEDKETVNDDKEI